VFGFAMDQLFPFLVVGFVVGIMILVAVTTAVGESRRRAALMQVAEQLGLAYSEAGSELLGELGHFPLFSQGRSKRVSNLIQGETDEMAMGIFDYRYTTGSGKNSHTSRQTVAFFRVPGLNLPQFQLRPQHFLHSVGKLFGYQDIDFQSNPRFSKMFILRGTNETAVRQLFTSDLMSFLETKPTLVVEAQGQDVLCYRTSTRVKPDALQPLMREGFEVARQLQAAARG